MEYDVSIELEQPRDRVVALFDDPANLPKWQKGLKTIEPLSGTPGQEGAKSRLVFDMGKGQFEMTETITRRDLPDALDGPYEAKPRGRSTKWRTGSPNCPGAGHFGNRTTSSNSRVS